MIIEQYPFPVLGTAVELIAVLEVGPVVAPAAEHRNPVEDDSGVCAKPIFRKD